MAHIASRRNFLALASTALIATAGLAACTSVTNNGVTTITLNVGEIENYAKAGINAVSMILSISAFSTAIGPTAVGVISASSTVLKVALDAFSQAAGSQLTISYDNTDWKTRVNSVLNDLEDVSSKLDSAINGAASIVSSTVLADVNTAYNALQTLISFFKGTLGAVSVRSVAALTMTKPQAFAVLGIK